MLLIGGVLALSGLLLISLEYHLIATLLFFIGVLTVTAVLGERICVFCLLLNITNRIFHKESVEQKTCQIRFDPSASVDSGSSD